MQFSEIENIGNVKRCLRTQEFSLSLESQISARAFAFVLSFHRVFCMDYIELPDSGSFINDEAVETEQKQISGFNSSAEKQFQPLG